MAAIEKQIGEEIYSHIDRLTGEITALQTHHRTDISPKYDLNDAKYRAYGQHDLQQLAESADSEQPISVCQIHCLAAVHAERSPCAGFLCRTTTAN